MNVTLQTLGVAGQAAGIALLYLHWRSRQSLGGAALTGGWALILIGMVPWLFGVSVERGLALASIAPMVAGLLLSAPSGLADMRGTVKDLPARRRTTREVAQPAAASPSPGRHSRNAARWVGALIVVPALAIAAMAAWQALMPGSAVNRASFSIFVLMIVWMAALLWQLASVKPWRVTLIAAFGAVALGGGVFILTSGGTA